MDTPLAAPMFAGSRSTLSVQVARHVLERIRRGGLKPGDTAPSELQICRDLQVGRGTVREAYRALAALGVLEISGGRRPRLRPVGPDVLADVFAYAIDTAQIAPRQLWDVRDAVASLAGPGDNPLVALLLAALDTAGASPAARDAPGAAPDGASPPD